MNFIFFKIVFIFFKNNLMSLGVGGGWLWTGAKQAAKVAVASSCFRAWTGLVVQ
jgi:hypothetical protein